MNNVKLSQRQLQFTLCSKSKNILSSVISKQYLNLNKVKGRRIDRQNRKKGIVKKLSKTEITNQRLDNIKEVLSK